MTLAIGNGPASTYHSNKNPCAWQRAEPRSRLKDKIPSYAIRQATQAPTLAMEAKKIKVFGMVRIRLNKAKVMKIKKIPKSDSVAPIRSTALRMLIWPGSSMANSRSSATGTSIVEILGGEGIPSDNGDVEVNSLYQQEKCVWGTAAEQGGQTKVAVAPRLGLWGGGVGRRR